MLRDWQIGVQFDPVVAATVLLGIAAAVFLVTNY
jgi:hypothetical protein